MTNLEQVLEAVQDLRPICKECTISVGDVKVVCVFLDAPGEGRVEEYPEPSEEDLLNWSSVNG